ncbi:polysaccharide deacetylase family protein [Pontibacter ruber]|uniref:polysaccharide deacetylase family protein n=1 Tax=Pontibacter ruber TaxID=1343895 RepID=UPI00202867EA|nr:polysaccharide deacetylase family protein [Pontibacter ruber]
MVFTGDESADGAESILQTLKKHQAKASFFLTGRFYSNQDFKQSIQQLKREGYYLGAHSDAHLLYCDWTKRDSLLVTKQQFSEDLQQNYNRMAKFGIRKKDAPYFLPPYEWYNHQITNWTTEEGLQLVNFTPGTRSAADYTYPEMGTRYVGSETILQSIFEYEHKDPNGLNGFLLLLHIGTDPRREDKFYYKLDELLTQLKVKGYRFVTVSEQLSE